VDKYACSVRTYIAGGFDCSSVLRAFARQCALDLSHLWDAPQIVKDYLNTGDENLRAAASDAAWAAASAAAWAVARAVASAAARDKQNKTLTKLLEAAIKDRRR
jgi:hypothetical protein